MGPSRNECTRLAALNCACSTTVRRLNFLLRVPATITRTSCSCSMTGVDSDCCCTPRILTTALESRSRISPRSHDSNCAIGRSTSGVSFLSIVLTLTMASCLMMTIQQ